MAGDDDPYRLVLFTAPEDPRAVRDLLCEVTGLHPTEAMLWVARAPGILPRPLGADEVRALLDGLFELGIPAEAWRADALPVLGPPRTIHSAACLDDGFRVQGLRGEPTHWVPWDRVELISAGRIQATDEYRDVEPPSWPEALAAGLGSVFRGRRRRPGRRRRARRVVRDPVGEVILVRREPRLSFRAVATEMSYAYLGDRLRPSAAENFPVFLADLCRGARRAYVTGPTRDLLDGHEPEAATFPSSQALLDYSTHRLLWSWYRRDRDAQQETEA
ncbi:MAG TPA: hypothetical protein VG406_12845 [Isosphaeraceae bacterium]|jgi:hypothetical protein|nr:hypothetical protein [Isosphaeraceae bacterium]